MQPQLLTSKNENWCTPPVVLDRVALVDAVGLDPCSNVHSIVSATTWFDLLNQIDGLVASWQNQGLVYVNPPYGRKMPHWTRKIAAEAAAGTEIIALLPARTDTRWFHNDILPYADSILLWKGRIKFIDGTTGLQGHPAPFPSMVTYYGPRTNLFAAAFSDVGYILER